MDTDTELQDLQERILGVVEEAMDYAFHEGVFAALAASEAATQAEEARVAAEAEDELLRLAEELGISLDEDDEPCTCLFCQAEAEEALALAANEAEGCGCEECSPDPEPFGDEVVLLTQGEYASILERLEAVEYEAGLKYVG